MSQAVVNLANNVAKSINISAIVYSTSANFRLQVTDGITTTNDAHDGSGWNRLSLDFTPGNAATALTCRINHTTASSLTLSQETGIHLRGPYSLKIVENGGQIAYVDSMYAPDSFTQYDYPVSSDFHTIHSVEIENGGLISQFSSGQLVGGSGDPVSRRGRSRLTAAQWRATSGHVNPSPTLRFDSNQYRPDSDRAITVSGMTTPAIPTIDTETITANVDPIVEYAVYWLTRYSDPTASAVALNRWREARDDVRTPYPSNSKVVNPL